MAKKKSKKKVIIVVIVLLLLAAAGTAAAIMIPKMNAEPVFVYGFQDGIPGMTDYYEGSGQSEGMVRTDRVQPIYLTDTQTVTEVLVTEGQEVKKGDVLYTYDTTLSDIALQRKALSVEQLKLDLLTAQKELAVINSYVPIAYLPEPTPDPEAPPPEEEEEVTIADLDLSGKDYAVYSGEGDTSLTPYYAWLRSDAMIDELMMEALYFYHSSDSLYIVFQHTEDDSNEGAITDEYGLKILRVKNPVAQPDGSIKEDITYRMSFFEPPVKQNEEPEDNIQWNSGFTAAEIHSMRVEKQEQIKDLEFDIRMAEAEYRIMEKEADDGSVEAEFDGMVVGLMDPEFTEPGMPFMKVSGGGGFYIDGYVSELALGSVQLGQKVTVMDWNSGMEYEGEVVELQPFPMEQEYYYYGGSQNVSYYPYTVFVDESAMLQDGYYVSMTLQAGEGESGLYIENAYVLTEGASNYVYVRGEDGLLEKRQIRLGGMLWGQYSKVLGGLTAEDYVAFPYGKDVKAGAPTVEGTWQDLYGY